MIDRLLVCKLTTMGECELDLSPKLNVIIGANGMGKTHLLKAGYGLSFAKSALLNDAEQPDEKARKAISNKLVHLFKPANHKLGRLHRSGEDEDTELIAQFADGESLEVSFSGRDTYATVHREKPAATKLGRPVFIPTKEVLSFLDGITAGHADEDTLALIFDDTYRDIFAMLAKPVEEETSDRVNNDPRFGTIFPDIGNAIGGQFTIHDGKIRFFSGEYQDRRVREQKNLGVRRETVFKRSKGDEISGHMTAEGFRKIGMLQQLLANRSLDPGVSGPLFWDEPEANMNPRLMRLMVQILLVITRSNQQVVVATHDYILLKWIDLLADSSLGDHVRYHSLYRPDKSDSVTVNTTDEYTSLSPNAIDETFGELTDEEISQSMGDLGK
ncbi:MAG: AAA family ATPase [Phycisphaera sp. RhM]|nr:AAA family ATPase [Phycisphaera sp. RhM]